MPEALLASFVPFVAALSACFTAPSFVTFQHIVAGWVLCVGRHTVTGVVRAWGRLLPADEPIVVSLDDTLSRHSGKHIRGASNHHDPLLSTRAKPVFHWGHVWVVVSIVVRVPLWKKTFALPVLARLYRSEKLCAKDKRPFH